MKEKILPIIFQKNLENTSTSLKTNYKIFIYPKRLRMDTLRVPQ